MVLGFFGAQVEHRPGGRGLALLLLITAVLGGLVQALIGYPYFGFRGCGYALLAAFAAINPRAQVLLLVFPVPAWLLVAILVFIDVATAVGHVGGEGVMGHLLGVGTGLVAILGQPTWRAGVAAATVADNNVTSSAKPAMTPNSIVCSKKSPARASTA